MSAAGTLKKVFAVIVRKAEADEAFAEEILGALGDAVATAARAPRAALPRAPAVDVSGIDLEAAFEKKGRAQLEMELGGKGYSKGQLQALIAREGVAPLGSKATKGELAYALVSHLARKLGKVDLGTA